MYDSRHYLMKLYESQNGKDTDKTKGSLKLWIENQCEENISVLRNKKVYRYIDLLLLPLLYYYEN